MDGVTGRIMDSKEVLKLYRDTVKNSPPLTKLKSSIKNPGGSYRPNTISVEDVYFGDSGKGSVVAKYNNILAKDMKLVSLRFNGGANAGHETMFNGKLVVTHQLPTAVAAPGAVAIISRGMLIHPEDLLVEINEVKEVFSGILPGQLLIDERVTLALDTHRAFEGVLNGITTGGRGSTGRGIATGYSSHYERFPVILKDLLSHRWEDIFRAHYRIYEKLVLGSSNSLPLSEIEVLTYSKNKGEKRKVGDEDTFISRLKLARSEIRRYRVDNMHDVIKQAWQDTKVAVTIEGAQGAGLDPYHGVYPDVTSSRPMSRFMNDATYNIILPEDILFRVAVMKTTYMSSVGRRVLPDMPDEEKIKWIQSAFDERGRTSGRLRDIYPVSIPIAQYLRRAAGYTCIAATHLDASKVDSDIEVVTHYTKKDSGEEGPYLPYQDILDEFDPNFVKFSGWDGEEVKTIHNPKNLPLEALQYLHFLDKTIAPVVMATTGPDLEDYILW